MRFMQKLTYKTQELILNLNTSLQKYKTIFLAQSLILNISIMNLVKNHQKKT